MPLLKTAQSKLWFQQRIPAQAELEVLMIGPWMLINVVGTAFYAISLDIALFLVMYDFFLLPFPLCIVCSGKVDGLSWLFMSNLIVIVMMNNIWAQRRISGPVHQHPPPPDSSFLIRVKRFFSKQNACHCTFSIARINLQPSAFSRNPIRFLWTYWSCLLVRSAIGHLVQCYLLRLAVTSSAIAICETLAGGSGLKVELLHIKKSVLFSTELYGLSSVCCFGWQMVN